MPARNRPAASGRNDAVNTVDCVVRGTPCSHLPAGTAQGSSEMGSCRHDSHGRIAERNAPFNVTKLPHCLMKYAHLILFSHLIPALLYRLQIESTHRV